VVVVADEDADDELSGLRGLLRPGDEINFFTDVDAPPSMASPFEQLIEESIGRVRASADEAAAIRQRYLDGGKPFGLFLRSFEREAYHYDIPAGGSGAPQDSELWRVAGPQSVERRLHAALHPIVPLLSVRNPSDLVVDSIIPRLSATDQDWEGVVERLALDASLIVFDCFALAPGVTVELELIRRCGRTDETVVLISDPSTTDSPGILMLKALAERGLELPDHERPSKDHPALAGFSRVAYESEIDWAHLATSEIFRDLIQAAERQEAGDLTLVRLEDRVRLLRERAQELRASGDHDGAACTAEEALALAEELGDSAYLAHAHLTRGTTALDRDDLLVALESFQTAGLIFNGLDDKDGESAAAMWAGVTLTRGGEPDAAVQIFLVALQRASEIGAHEDMVATLQAMAPLLHQVSRKTRQHPGVRRAAELIQALGLE
jgi:hypothetical protein